MTRDELARAYLAMREVQKRYFNPKTRTQDVLLESKKLEHALDEECQRIVAGPTLFLEDR
jgi:hypothetical protein